MGNHRTTPRISRTINRGREQFVTGFRRYALCFHHLEECVPPYPMAVFFYAARFVFCLASRFMTSVEIVPRSTMNVVITA
jgi:hypothetical protein